MIEKQKADPSSLTTVEITTLEFLNKKGSQFLLIYTVAQCLETIIGKPIPNKFDVRFSVNESPFKLAKEWDSILDIVLPLSGQLDGAFTKGRVTTDGVKKTIPNFIGVFASIANVQQATFQAFAKKIKAS